MEAHFCCILGIISMKLFNIKTLAWQAVLPQVTRHLVRLAKLSSQENRLQAAIHTRLFAAINKGVGNPIATCVQSTTVPSFSKRNVSRLSTIRIATYTTPHLEAGPVASTAAATINIQSQEPSSRDPMRFREKQCSIRLIHCHKEYPMHCMHQLWMLTGAT